MEARNFDETLKVLGTGKWNLFYYISLSYWYSLVSYHTLGGAFLAPPVDYTCRLPSNAITPTLVLPPNSSLTTPTNSSNYELDERDISSLMTSCSYEVEDPDTGKLEEMSCTEWDFDNSTYISTVTSEFSLVCDREYLRATYQSIYMFGILVGAGVNGYLADRFGRKRMVSIGTSVYSIIAVASCWLPNISTILAARFFLGTMHPTSLQTGYILSMEVTEPKLRSVIGVVQFLSWALGTMMWGVWAYAVREWRWLQFMVSMQCFLFLPCLWVMDESPRWLIVRGRHKEALEVLQKAARWNKATLPPKENLEAMMKYVQETVAPDNKESGEETLASKLLNVLKGFALLFKTPRLRTITLVLYVEYFVTAMVYFGLTLSAGALGVNPYLYVVISGIMEVPSNTITIPIVAHLGRKYPVIVSFFMCGICMLLQAFIPAEYQWLVITVVMIGKVSISVVFQIISLHASELFPTEVRTRGVGTAMMSSRVGAMTSPFLMNFLGAVYPWITPVVFGVTSIIAGFAALPLIETKDVVLPDTIADLETRDFKKTDFKRTAIAETFVKSDTDSTL